MEWIKITKALWIFKLCLDTSLLVAFDRDRFLELCESQDHSAAIQMLQQPQYFKASDCQQLTEKIAQSKGMDLSFAKQGLVANEVLETWTHLEELDLSNQRFADLDFLKDYANLKSLSLNSAIIETDLSTLKGLRSLEKLSLTSVTVGGHKLINLSFLQSLAKLRQLYLADNAIEDLLPIAQLHALRVLVLSNNPLETLRHLPESPEMVRLELAATGLVAEQLPWIYQRLQDDSFLPQTKLRYLDLDDNEIQVPVGFQGLRNLYYLGLAENQIASVQPIVKARTQGRDSFARLKYLDLYTKGVRLDNFDLGHYLSNLSAVRLWGAQPFVKCPLTKASVSFECRIEP